MYPLELASDIAELYHSSVTLLHSRKQLLSRFHPALGDEGMSLCKVTSHAMLNIL